MFVARTAVKSEVSERVQNVLQTGFRCSALWSPVEKSNAERKHMMEGTDWENRRWYREWMKIM